MSYAIIPVTYVILMLPFWVQRIPVMLVALVAAVAGTLWVVHSAAPVEPAIWWAMTGLAIVRRVLNVVVNQGTYTYMHRDVANPIAVEIVPHRALSLFADLVTIVMFGIVFTLTVRGSM